MLPLLVRHIARITQLAPIVSGSVLFRPHLQTRESPPRGAVEISVEPLSIIISRRELRVEHGAVKIGPSGLRSLSNP
jgi:hypothetical protein